MDISEKSRPWYREFWPWFVMLFPATAVVGGIITFRVAATSYDGMVEDDYYKQGMAINRTLARDQAAASVGLNARLQFSGGQASLRLDGRLAEWPPLLRLRLLHPTRSGMDQTVLLAAQGDGRYTGAYQAATGKWNLVLEDERKTWRLVGQWDGRRGEAGLAPVE
jgi:hypothetical protein